MAIGRIPEPGTGIPESIVDAKGDIVTATAADTPARLAVGTTEHRLVAASGEATGLKYVADTTNYAVAAKGDLLVGTAADTLAALPVGTNTYTLVADSAEATGLKWVAPAGGAGITLIDELAFSASQTINVNDVFSSTYKNYRVFITGTSTSSNPLTMRLRLSGSDTSTDYTNQSLIVDATSTTARRNYTGNDDWQLGDINADAATFEILIFNPNIADKTGYSCTNGLLLSSINNLTESFTGFQTGNTQFTGFTLLSASNATGTVFVYGYAKE